jgi:hypothetical protein
MTALFWIGDQIGTEALRRNSLANMPMKKNPAG